ALAKPCRVLVVDDSETDAFLMLQLLSLMGHTVAAVHKGRDALEQLAAFSPDVIITDIAMPEMDGIELARRIRAAHQQRRILLVALTEYELESDGDELVAADFDVLLTKPVQIAELQALFDVAANRLQS